MMPFSRLRNLDCQLKSPHVVRVEIYSLNEANLCSHCIVQQIPYISSIGRIDDFGLPDDAFDKTNIDEVVWT
jgi:hypothetical protein